MGYRSEVVLAIRAGVEVPPEIQADLDAIFPDERRVATGVLYHNGWVKWYGYDINDNPEPTRITRWLDLLDWDDFHFMRMGEDDGDMEEDGGWGDPFDLGYTRHLTCGGKRFDEVAS